MKSVLNGNLQRLFSTGGFSQALESLSQNAQGLRKMNKVREFDSSLTQE